MIADRIKLLREKSGLNQSELAEKLHLSRNSISAYEKGLNIPSTQKIAELAKILGVSVDCVLGIDETATISVKGLDDREVAILVEIAAKFRENKLHSTST